MKTGDKVRFKPMDRERYAIGKIVRVEDKYCIVVNEYGYFTVPIENIKPK